MTQQFHFLLIDLSGEKNTGGKNNSEFLCVETMEEERDQIVQLKQRSLYLFLQATTYFSLKICLYPFIWKDSKGYSRKQC